MAFLHSINSISYPVGFLNFAGLYQWMNKEKIRFLLADYGKSGSEQAFQELVSSYIDLVYSTAVRLTGGDFDLAKDVAQIVFIHLANNAYRLPSDVSLGGWLHRDTCNVSAKVMRSESRRRNRERQAMDMNVADHTQENLSQIAPLLDEAVNCLGEEDRKAIILRYFERRDFKELGKELGSNEDAAQKRVTRALDKLQVLLKNRGVTISSAVLGTALTSGLIHGAPAGLAASISGLSLASVALGQSTAVLAPVLSWTNYKAVTLLGTFLVGGLGVCLVSQHRSIEQMTTENQELREQVNDLKAREQSISLSQPTASASEKERLQQEKVELLRLRGEVTLLRQQLNTQKQRSGQQTALETNASDIIMDPIPIPQNWPKVISTSINSGQTLVTGGWTNDTGNRVFAFSIPQISGVNSDEIELKTCFIELTPSALTNVGLDKYFSENKEEQLQKILSPNESEAIMNALNQAKGTSILGAPRITTRSGQQCQIQMPDKASAQGNGNISHQIIDYIPTINANKNGIDLKVIHQPYNLLESQK